MPNRLLRDGICTSDLIDSLSPEEEVFFYRLLVVADDYGHADARPAILKSLAFPLKESVTPKKIESWVDGLVQKGAIRRYRVSGKVYLAVCRWEARIRTHPKHPLPDSEGAEWVDPDVPQFGSNLRADCGDPPAECGQDAAIGGLGKGKGKGKGATLTTLPDGWSPKPETQASIAAKFSLSDSEVIRYVDAFRDACAAKGYRYADFDAAFRNCVVQDWPRLRVGKPAPTADGKPRLAI